MAKIEDFVEAAHQQTQKEFATQYDCPFLVLRIESQENGAAWSFKTQTIASRKINVARVLHGEGLELSKESHLFRIFPIAKRGGNPWREHISVGRARNNDIVLPHKSVSKLHGHFLPKNSSLTVVDAGSRNGTRVNDERLTSGVSVKVKVGDTITFGGITLELLAPEALYDLVQAHLQHTDKK